MDERVIDGLGKVALPCQKGVRGWCRLASDGTRGCRHGATQKERTFRRLSTTPHCLSRPTGLGHVDRFLDRRRNGGTGPLERR